MISVFLTETTPEVKKNGKIVPKFKNSSIFSQNKYIQSHNRYLDNNREKCLGFFILSKS